MLTIWFAAFLLCFLSDVNGLNLPPEVTFVGINRQIPEDTPPGEVVFRVIANDSDSPLNSLELSLDSNTFRLLSNGHEGNVILIKTLNYEASTTAEFRLTVSDGQSDTTYDKVIQVQDVNDVKPAFSQLRYQQHLPENSAVGTLIFPRVSVTDLDVSNDVIEVVCTYDNAFPDACNIFYVNTTAATNTFWRGNVYLQRPLDYETMQETYQLLLTAKDGNAENDYQMNFEIVIDDVTDAPPYFTATFDARINEDVDLGTYVLTVQAVDGDKNDQRSIRYSIVDNPGNFFIINRNTGNISTARPLDINSEFIGPQGIVTLNVTAQELLSDGSLGVDSTTQSFAPVKITIVDVNNNRPTFRQNHYSVRMSESLQNGQAIPNLTMHVSDADGAENAHFKFVFAGLRDYEEIFRVNPPEAQGSTTATIVIRNSSALDYDFGLREYTLEVIAREVFTNSNLSSTAVVTIYLDDANDNEPKFDVDSFSINELSELTQPGELIATLPLATDVDTGAFGTAGIVYTLIGFGNNRFDLDPLTADLKLTQCSIPGTGDCLDYESVRHYNLSLLATDNNGTAHETRIPLYISILDENDNIPVFTSNSYQFRVRETTTILRTEQQIFATDRDSSRNGNNRIRYSLVTDRSRLFSIDVVTGELTLARPVEFRDGDENGRLRITVGAGNLLDGASRVDYTRNTTVEILVEDINNNAPQFAKNYSISIRENIRPDIEILRVKADDDDFGQNAAVEYSIISGGGGVFNIDINTGVISRRNGAVLDADVTPTYNIRVRATDKGNPRLSGFAIVIITIIDSNINFPYFDPLTTTANVSEDAELDFNVVSMQALDRDNNADLRYSFIEPITAYNLLGQRVSVEEYDYTALFRIDSQTGQVFVNRALDVTKVQRIIYSVQAHDVAAEGPDQIGTGTLIIDIINANNHAPQFENVNRLNSINEEQIPGTLVMFATATDGDRDLIKYSIISQSIPGIFSIHPVTGLVTVAGRIDYEAVRVITFTVRASDGDSPPFRYTDHEFSVNVVNINDNRPIFSREYYEAELRENNTNRQTVTTVLATDLDRPPYGDVKYRLPSSVTQFRIDEVTGVLYKIPSVVFDREAIKEIQIPVIAYDGPGTPSRSSVVLVHIAIKDINDNSPYFHESDVYVTLSNELPVGSSVVRLYAFDNDVNDDLTYSISGDPTGRYEISPQGVVRTRRPLTTAPDHVFDVVATDRAGNFAVVHVHATIIGNQRGPEWIFPSFDGDKIRICENQQQRRVTVINPSQLIAAAGAVRYSFMVNGKETDEFEETFRLIPESGEILAKKNLDRESRDKYLMQVLAKDINGLISQRYLMIEICDENDNQPEFSVHSNGTIKDFHFYIRSGLIQCVKESVNSDVCGRVTAFDPDLAENARIVYTLHNGTLTGGPTGEFIIDPDTGIISTVRGLDFSTPLYIIQVTASNIGIINNSARRTANVYIHVLPEPTIPGLIKDNVNLYTPLDTQIGSCLDTMRPEGLQVAVTYSIRSERLYYGRARMGEGDNLNRFSVTPQRGTICTIQLFNPNYAGYHYRLLVNVNARAGESSNGTANIWLTENIHKIRIVIDGTTTYVNNNRLEILEALRQIIGTDIVWIDSVGHYTTKDSLIDISKSDVIIYAVNMTTRYLFRRNETITYINDRVKEEYRNIALSAKIIGAEDITTTYIYLTTPRSEAVVREDLGVFPVGLLIAMLLLLLPLLLPFLLCCLFCCPCCASLFGRKDDKYVVLGAAPAAGGYEEGSFIDEWYEQSKLYNNPAYVDHDWDSGSAHMVVSLNKGSAANGIAGGAGQETTEETEEYYMTDGNRATAMADESAVWDRDSTDGEARMLTAKLDRNFAASAKAESAVIVDSLTPAAGATGEASETVVMEEERTERRLQEEQKMRSEKMQPLVTSLNTDHHQLSSLSPATIDILDSASTYNAKVAAKGQADAHYGHFSHTATVPRYGNRYPPESDDYITSESYESDYHSDNIHQQPSRSRYHRESGMTIVLDAQPSRGMEVENVEYEVLTSPVANGGASHHSRSGYVSERSNTYRGSHSGTIPRNGFTIELEPTTHGDSGMVADREEYVLTDDEGLSPEFFNEAPQSPKQHKRYKKSTTTRMTKEGGNMSGNDYY